MRALILRRVGLIEMGVGGPDADRRGRRHGDVIRLQGFLTRNGYPHHMLDPGARTRGERSGSPDTLRRPKACRSWSARTAPCCKTQAKPLCAVTGHDRPIRARITSTMSPSSAPDRPASRRRSMRRPKAFRVIVLEARFRRPGGRQRAHRELFRLSDRHFRSGVDRPRVRPGAEVRRGNHDPRVRQGAGLCARQRRPGLELDGGQRVQARTVVVASGARYRRPATRRSRPFRGTRRLVLGLADRGAVCAGEEVMLVGGGNSAGQAAVFLSAHAAKVRMMVRARGSPKACRAISSTGSRRRPISN